LAKGRANQERNDDPTVQLGRALRRMLRPLVRLLVSHAVTYPIFIRWLKPLFLEAAEAELGASASASQIHLATGLHRKDIRRLREPEVARSTSQVALGARLVARWLADPRFCDASGRVLPLPFRSREAPSFVELVESVSRDVRPRAVLEDWLRLGVAFLGPEEEVHLTKLGFVPSDGFAEKTQYLARNLHDHIAAASRNLRGAESPLLERSVHYNRLSSESVAELETLARDLGSEVLTQLNRRALSLQRRDVQAGDTEQRMHFGVYFFEEEDSEQGSILETTPDPESADV